MSRPISIFSVLLTQHVLTNTIIVAAHDANNNPCTGLGQIQQPNTYNWNSADAYCRGVLRRAQNYNYITSAQCRAECRQYETYGTYGYRSYAYTCVGIQPKPKTGILAFISCFKKEKEVVFYLWNITQDQRVWNTQDPQSQQAPAYRPAPPLGYPTGSSAYSRSSPTPKGYSTRDGTTGDGTRALSYGTNSGRRLPRIRLESPDTSPVRSPKNRENGNGGSAIPADYPYAEITASAAAFGAKGKRDHMEDRFVIDETLKKQFGVSIYAVFDGHGGDATSEWARVNIIQALKDQIQLEKQRILWKLQEEMAKFKYSWVAKGIISLERREHHGIFQPYRKAATCIIYGLKNKK